MKLVEPDTHLTLDAYASVAQLVAAVESLRAAGRTSAPLLEGRTVWHVNSTAQGGGVAELLPPQIALLRGLGVDARWLVMETDRAEFFAGDVFKLASDKLVRLFHWRTVLA